MKKKVEFKIGREALRGILFTPQGKGLFPGVVFFHGSGGSGNMFFDIAEKLSENGIMTLAFNYRGAGKSDGIFEEQTLDMGIKDAKAALIYFLSLENLDKERVGLCGGSFGGFLAGLLAAKFPIKSLILNAPAAYSQNELDKQRDSAGELDENFLESGSYKQIAVYKGKLLVVESEFDDVLLPEMVKHYFNNAKSATKKEYYILKDAKHRLSNDPPRREVFTKKVIEWFLETL